MIRTLYACLSVVALTTASSLAQASERPVITQIRAAVVEQLGGAIRADDVAVGAGLIADPCTAPLQVTHLNQRTVEVRCPGKSPWKVYVQLRMQKREAVVVVKRPVRVGMPFTAEQLELQVRDVAALTGVPYLSVEEVVGRAPVRGMPPGAVVLQNDTSSSEGVKRGDPVTIRAGNGTFVVEVQGRVAGRALIGQSVMVENISSGRIMRGRLVEKGVVSVEN